MRTPWARLHNMVYRDDAAIPAYPAMSARTDPIQVAVRVLVYIVLYILSAMIFGWAFTGLGLLLDAILTSILAAGMANWLGLRIFEGRHLVDAGLWWNRMSR